MDTAVAATLVERFAEVPSFGVENAGTLQVYFQALCGVYALPIDGKAHSHEQVPPLVLANALRTADRSDAERVRRVA